MYVRGHIDRYGKVRIYILVIKDLQNVFLPLQIE